MNSTGGGSYICRLIFKKFVCMATTGAGEILAPPPPHACSLSEACQPRSRLTAEPFRLIHSFIIRSSAPRTRPPPHLLPTPLLLISTVPPTGGRAGVSIDPKWQPPPRACCLETPICQTWQGQKQPRFSRNKGQRRALCSGAAAGGRDVATHHEIICFMRGGASHLSCVAEKQIFSRGNVKDRGRR